MEEFLFSIWMKFWVAKEYSEAGMLEMLRKVFGDRIVAQKSFVSGTKRSNQAENGLKINRI